jgi:hypothetical protein
MFLLIFAPIISYGQEPAEPYTARAYWMEEQNQNYQILLQRKALGDTLSNRESEWLKEYMIYLDNYFTKLSPEERLKYRESRDQWNLEAGQEKKELTKSTPVVKDEEEFPVKKYSTYLFNGFYGLTYGIMSIYALELDEDGGAGIAAIPFFTAGLGLLSPSIFKEKYNHISYGSLLLSRHGKLTGFLHGAALGVLAFGEEPEHPGMILGPMIVGSIALGEWGYHLGLNRNWTAGKAATFKYYGIFGPWIGFSTLVAAGAERGRIYGAVIPVSAVAGYYAASKIYKKNQFTRGDIIAATSFALYSTGAGFGLIPIEDEWEIIIPAVTSIGGTMISHSILKKKHLTSRQGWNVNYISGAAALMGLGIAVATGSDSHYPYFLLPAGTGILGWLLATNKQNPETTQAGSKFKHDNFSVSFDITPENYFINKKLAESSSFNQQRPLSLFSLNITL